MTRKSLILVSAAFLSATFLQAQTRLPAYDSRINPQLLSIRSEAGPYNASNWTASWVTSPDAGADYGVYLFRRSFSLDARPESFIVNVSADNRYKLYVNGSFVSAGPSKCDPHNWSFDTADIARYLKEGDNTIAAVVWNFAAHRPVAVMSMNRTGFLLQGNGQSERFIDTGKDWKVLRCLAYSPLDPKVRGYYAAGCLDRFDASFYPWGWEMPAFDDSLWKDCKVIRKAALKGSGDYPYWQLVPRPIPPMEYRDFELPQTIGPQTFAPHTVTEIILDNKVLTTGYPKLSYSGGKGGEITISYAESLYDGPGYSKGDRNVTEGKEFVGYSDVIISDGGAFRSFEPLWWRTWRYLKLTVKTADKPLTIAELTATSTMYPFECATTFSAPEMPELNDMLDIGWRTARLCAHETYMDCPYYEQLQYFGDSRIQALVTMYNTRDNYMVRNLLEQGRQSVNSDGLVASRYPSHLHQFIPPYALSWISICHDWWMYRGDEDYLRTLIPTMRSVLSFFKEYLCDDWSLRGVPYWNFADWAGLESGLFPMSPDGSSAYMDLIYVLALTDASEMEAAMGSAAISQEYSDIAGRVSRSFTDKYLDTSRGLFADDREHTAFSQHINSLAILAGIVDGQDACDLMDNVLKDSSLRQCTIYFRYYLQRAMALSGHGDKLISSLDVLRDQMKLGLTTWAEMPEPSRSDCHAWGASPNIEFYRTILGIDSSAPGFRKVNITPDLCGLTRISGSIPHPDGTISVLYRVDENGHLHGTVMLPPDVDGLIWWNGQSRPLTSGINKFVMIQTSGADSNSFRNLRSFSK